MRVVMAILLSVMASGVAFGQGDAAAREGAGSPPQEVPDEVVVSGRRVAVLRAEVQTARELAYSIFNELNSNDDFDVYCRQEGRTGTRSTQRVCRAQFENRISADAASEYMSQLFALCQPDPATGVFDTQACMFGGTGQAARSAAQGVETQLPSMRDRMTDEILRLAREDDRFAQAILDWYEANQQYDAARRRRDD